MDYLVANPDHAEDVAKYVFQWNFDYFSYHHNQPYLRLVKAISSYNTGFTYAADNVIKYVYVKDIHPAALSYVMTRYRIIWKGKKYLKIGKKL